MVSQQRRRQEARRLTNMSKGPLEAPSPLPGLFKALDPLPPRLAAPRPCTPAEQQGSLFKKEDNSDHSRQRSQSRATALAAFRSDEVCRDCMQSKRRCVIIGLRLPVWRLAGDDLFPRSRYGAYCEPDHLTAGTGHTCRESGGRTANPAHLP